MMKSLTFILGLLFYSQAFGQVITCNDFGCVPDGITATVAEKAGYSSIDMGYNSIELFNVVTGTGNTTKDLRLNLSNGEFPGKSMKVDLSSNVNGKNAGNLIVIGDNIDTLDIKLNGWNGNKGQDAAEICATRIQNGLYGNDVKARFLLRRSTPGNGLVLERCVQADVDDITSNKFSCNDTSYTSLNSADPKVNITRVRKNSKCIGIAPQSVCVQKSYNLTCSYIMTNRHPDGEMNFWYASKSWVQRVGCYNGGPCGSFPACNGNDNLRKNGAVVFSNGIGTGQPYEFTKTYPMSSKELARLQGIAGGRDICQTLVDEDPQWSTKLNNWSAYYYYNGKRESSSCDVWSCKYGCYMSDHGMIQSWSASGNDMAWRSISNNTPQETGPGLNATRDGLENGSPYTPSPNGNGALRSVGPGGEFISNTNTQGNAWQMEIMPAFHPTCNPFFSYLTTKTENMIKTIFDPNEFNNNSAFCIDRNNPSNCTHPPACDNPESSVNCRKISACEQINRRYCLDNNNPVNCTNPPFCNDPTNSTNCSTTNYANSCDVGGPAENNFCTKDGFNRAQYQFIGTEPDPFKNTESVDCKINNCPAQYKTLELNSTLDTLNPTDGQNGTLPGQGLFFVYDIRQVVAQAIPGQAGVGGKSDIVAPPEVRYCGTKRDFTTDPNTKYENDPEITFKKVNWKAFEVREGANPGQFPPFTDKKVEIYKKIDSSARYWLKKELL